MSDIDFGDVTDHPAGAVEAFARRGRARYADLVAAGRMVEPRQAGELGEGGPRVDGAILLGPLETRGNYRVATLWLLQEGTAHRLTPRFRDAAEARRFRARLSLRAGPRFGEARDPQALDALEAHLFCADLARPLQSAGNVAVATALDAWLSGGALDLGGLYGTREPYEHILDCGSGLVWHRVATVEGATLATRDAMIPVNRDFETALAESPDDDPADSWYALRAGEGGHVAVLVRVPWAGSGRAPEVTGRLGGEPFTHFRRQIGMLADHLLVVLMPYHCRHKGPPVGRWDAEMAPFGL